MGRAVLEREDDLGAVREAVEEAARGTGSVLLVSGEEGIGKSTLVEAARAHLPATFRMLVGYCDDLGTPRTLGPFRDLIGSVGRDLAEVLQSGSDRDQILHALRAELDWPGHPTVLVIEDVHWADEATRDALGYLVRRIGALPAVLVLTYRDDEVGRDHPLRGLLGQAARSERVRHLRLRPLSPAAVRSLGAGRYVAPAELYALTAGNPFFVTELLSSDTKGSHIPPTVVDAVRGRVARLEFGARQVIEQLAVVPSTIDRWLVDTLTPDGAEALAEAEHLGLLSVAPARVAFRHELTRRAIADALPAQRRVMLNRRVLDALVAHGGVELARLVHHAAEAGDRDAIARYGPAAAREAALAGAHREAAAHYRLVLMEPGRFDHVDQAILFEEYAIECYTLGTAEAVDAQERAVALRRTLNDQRALGASLRWLSRIRWWAGDRAGAEPAGREAVDVLEKAGDGRLLALALSNQSQLYMLSARAADSVAIGERAAALAREIGDAPILSHALTNIGAARWNAGDRAGKAVLDEALRVALDARDVEDACRAYVGIVWTFIDELRLDDAQRYLDEAIGLAEESEFVGFLTYMNVERARLHFHRGNWESAIAAAQTATDAQAPMRSPALTVLGRVHVRRGGSEASNLLDLAWQLARGIDELQRTGPVAAARAEQAWLAGDLQRLEDVAAAVYEEARRLGSPSHEAELGFWLSRTGVTVEPLSGVDHPYAILARGDWAEAAAAFGAAGCPYEHALALAESPHPDDLLAALAILDRLGGRPLARRTRARLKALGVTHIPRGPRSVARGNPAGLTGRQLDVLRLLEAGYTNAEIAQQLVLSVRTVDAHVAAIIGKLDAKDRRAAVRRAADLGLLAP